MTNEYTLARERVRKALEDLRDPLIAALEATHETGDKDEALRLSREGEWLVQTIIELDRHAP